MEIAWLATSTYHDFNYSTQKYQSWLLEYLQEVLRLENSDVQKELSKLNLDVATVREKFLLTAENLMSIISAKNVEKKDRFRDEINLFLYEKIVKERNHGLLSGLTLLKIYKEACKKEKKILMTKEAVEQAALAISLHDEKMWEFFCGCKGYLLEEKKCEDGCQTKNKCNDWDKELKKCEILNTINFDTEPLIYLLILCDSSQDEGRVEKESSGIKSNLEEVEINEDGKVLITLSTEDANSYRVKHSEFSRVEQFLEDNGFKIFLKSNSGKTKQFTM